MQAPTRLEPKSLGHYLEVMSKAVFQSGMSWKVVQSKWPQIREAMRNFEIDAVATLSPDDLEALAQDKRVIRNRRKLVSIVHNAQRIVELDEVHGGFENYLRSHNSFELTVKDLRKQFKFLGDTGSYYFLYVIGENVPNHEDWMQSRQV
jgi:3-methyladenine DNA glycosylase Tag